MRSLLPFIFILICPLMMLFMMRGMHGRGAHAAEQDAADRKGIHEAGEDQLAELREQRDQLEARVDELETQLARIERSRERQQIRTSA
jgi:cell division protein FtsB